VTYLRKRCRAEGYENANESPVDRVARAPPPPLSRTPPGDTKKAERSWSDAYNMELPIRPLRPKYASIGNAGGPSPWWFGPSVQAVSFNLKPTP